MKNQCRLVKVILNLFQDLILIINKILKQVQNDF
jgi:hypothetical protein